MRVLTSLAAGAGGRLLLCWAHVASAQLDIRLSTQEGLSMYGEDSRVLVLFAPAGKDPVDDTDVTSTSDKFYGLNVFNFSGDAFLTGGSNDQPLTGVFGFPNVSLDDIAPGDYTARAFLNPYAEVTRSDGSRINIRMPCGDGAAAVNGPGSLSTAARNVTVNGQAQTIDFTFDNATAYDPEGPEIGGCHQGNYEDTERLKHIKIRSDILSKFWNRDMYVGANVLLPAGYDIDDQTTRYPVIYHQSHWPADTGLYGYSTDDDFTIAWDSGIWPNTTNKPTPKLILVTFRHESPFYDDSYAVNSANIGPYGDALNDELLPYIDEHFKTIAAPYARIQDGGSTGGWESAANLIFRPDLFGACFSSYPDSLSFNRHQDIPLYHAKNAYTAPNGKQYYSIREIINGTLTNVTTVAQENHWELTYGTNSRSSQQWDVWNAVFGAQGINGYPLEPWDKVTGEVFPGAVEYWKPMDLTNWIVSNWDNELNLGEVLKKRIFVYVGNYDNYFLNEGVEEFKNAVTAKGGADWANVTILEGQVHGGNYRLLDTWDYFELVLGWVNDHAPNGTTPLADDATKSTSRGNIWADVISRGGHGAAIARQAAPRFVSERLLNGSLQADVGRWDPGVKLEARWLLDDKVTGDCFAVEQDKIIGYTPDSRDQGQVKLQVTGRKRGYADETRTSNCWVL